MDILIAFLPLILFGVVIWFLLRMRRPRKRKPEKADHHTRQERAVWSWARIVSATNGRPDAGNRVRVEMQLEVHTPGSEAYQGRTTWLVEQDALAYVEEGKEISVKVDPLGPEYIYPNGPWAKYVE